MCACSNKMKRNFLIIVFVVVILIIVWAFAESKPNSPPYIENFLSENDFREICQDFDTRLSKMRHEKHENVNRQNQFVERDSIVYSILSRPEYREKLRSYMGDAPVYLARNHPIEYRRYFPGSFMKAHRDVQLYRVPQWECILTLFNTSDSRTLFYTDHSVMSIRPEPNSVMFVRANGVRHEVLPIREGERRFIKFIMTETDDRV